MVAALSLLFGAALAGVSPAVPDSMSYTMADAERELPSLVVVRSSRPGYHSLELDTVNAAGPLGALARANRHYVFYLTDNAPSRPLAPEARRGFDLAAVQRNVLARLSADTVYLGALVQGVQGMRARRAGAADGRAPDSRRAVSASRVMALAVRFFYPDAVLPDGHIQSHVCVGINGIADMQGGRDLALEAFAYAAIFHHYLRPRVDSNDDFLAASKLVNAMDLSTDPAVRLQRAQGVMWAAMLRSEKLRQALAAEYAQASAYLPFRIDGRLAPAAVTPEG